MEFELLDNKSDLIAYVWKESPFGETQMTKVSVYKFNLTLKDQTIGGEISYACKFASLSEV